MAITMPPSKFNPWTQPITFFNSDGSNFTINMEDLNDYRIYSGRLAINYGTQIGATLLLLLVLLLLTRSEKRRSSIFIINALCLTVNTIRCILLSCYVTSALQNPYTQFSGDYSQITQADYATNATTDVFTLLLFVLVMISLSIQVWVVCITTVPVQRYIIMGVTTVMALIATGYKAAFVILNIKATLGGELLLPFKKVVDASYITQAISIWLFSCVFTYKLGYAILQRRKLNMPQFRPMQVVFIMGCQTLLIPGWSFLPFAIPSYSSLLKHH
jgi:pheromone alpha factor receptor